MLNLEYSFVHRNNLICIQLQKAKKKPLKKVTISELGVDTAPRIEIVSVEEPPIRQAGSIVPDVDTLIAKLKEGGHIK